MKITRCFGCWMMGIFGEYLLSVQGSLIYKYDGVLLHLELDTGYVAVLHWLCMDSIN